MFVVGTGNLNEDIRYHDRVAFQKHHSISDDYLDIVVIKDTIIAGIAIISLTTIDYTLEPEREDQHIGSI